MLLCPSDAYHSTMPADIVLLLHPPKAAHRVQLACWLASLAAWLVLQHLSQHRIHILTKDADNHKEPQQWTLHGILDKAAKLRPFGRHAGRLGFLW